MFRAAGLVLVGLMLSPARTEPATPAREAPHRVVLGTANSAAGECRRGGSRGAGQRDGRRPFVQRAPHPLHLRRRRHRTRVELVDSRSGASSASVSCRPATAGARWRGDSGHCAGHRSTRFGPLRLPSAGGEQSGPGAGPARRQALWSRRPTVSRPPEHSAAADAGPRSPHGALGLPAAASPSMRASRRPRSPTPAEPPRTRDRQARCRWHALVVDAGVDGGIPTGRRRSQGQDWACPEMPVHRSWTSPSSPTRLPPRAGGPSWGQGQW